MFSSFAVAAARELNEETGLVVVPARLRQLCVTNDRLPEDGPGKHYITVHMITEWNGQPPTLTEPDKCEGWEWVDYHQLQVHLCVCMYVCMYTYVFVCVSVACHVY